MKQGSKLHISSPERLVFRCLPEFCHSLSAMLKAGLSIDAALSSEASKAWRGDFGKVLKSLHSDISQGKPFSEACDSFPTLFDPATRGLIKAGESVGRLAEVLEDIAVLIEARVALRKKIRVIMIYPSIVLAFAILLVSFLVLFVLPQFTNLYTELGRTLPAPTRLLISIGTTGKDWGIIVAVIIALLLAGLKILKQSVYGKVGMDWLALNIPGISNLVRVMSVARFTRTFGQMIKSGIPVLKAIDLAAGTTGNCIVEQLLIRARMDVEQGKLLSQALAAQKVFPDKLVKMVQVGEQTGRLDEMMENITKHYEQEIKSALDILLVLLLPLIILLFGGIVVLVVLAVFMPLFQLPSIVSM